MLKLLITVHILLSRCLAVFARFLEASATPTGAAGETLVANTRAGTANACRRSHLSFNRAGQMSELPTLEGLRAEAKVHFARERRS
ncbi:hypothetical protein FQZ97_868770 [compost metagenome]